MSAQTPLLLDRPGQAWLIEAGPVDVFAARRRADGLGAWRPLFRLEAGAALFGTAVGPADLVLLARGAAGACLRPLAEADELDSARAAARVEPWVRGLAAALAPDLPPADSTVLMAGRHWNAAAGEIVRAAEQILWLPPGPAMLLGEVNPDAVFPLAGNLWARCAQPGSITPLDTLGCAAAGALEAGRRAFQALAVDRLARQLEEAERSQRARLNLAVELDQQAVQRAVTSLAQAMPGVDAAGTAVVADAGPLLAVCRLIGAELGVTIQPAPRREAGSAPAPVEAIARASRLRTRRVALRGEWWRADQGPLLAFSEADQRPLALLRDRAGRYHAWEADGRTRQPVTSESAANLSAFAYTFYRSLPDRPVTALEFLCFGLRRAGPDWAAAALAGLAAGLVGLVPALATGAIFDTLIPAASRSRLSLFAGILIVAAISGALLQFVRNLALARLETRFGAATQAAVWDRVLALPMAFFKVYSSGDLATRIFGLETVRQTAAGLAGATLLPAVFSLTNLALLFYFDAGLAWAAMGLAGAAGLVIALAGRAYLRLARQINAAHSRLAGLVLELLTGIARLRVAGAEARAFAVWAGRFAEQRRLAVGAHRVGNGLAAFNAAFPLLAAAVLFGVLSTAHRTLTTGAVLAFVAAFSGLVSALLALGGQALEFLRVLPMFEHARPILTAAPEIGAHRAQPGVLQGGLTLSHISFRYRADGPAVLRDVSLAARPGEFVAIVGPSGSGKSSLLRLMLGFESPEAGAVYFDGQDLAILDVAAVRRQIGVVLQSSRLVPGTVFANIAGASLLTLEEAWAAARLAGLEADLRRMPMGMHTVIGEGAAAFSEGQRQRLLIARALAHRPRLLLFDEATSALDNRTQAVVSQSLADLQATRVVIAHRLSTIQHADRIYVLDAGRLVQQGTYADLAGTPGLFRELIRRQVVELPASVG